MNRKEAQEALISGKKIRRKEWFRTVIYMAQDGVIWRYTTTNNKHYRSDDTPFDSEICYDDGWELYEEPEYIDHAVSEHNGWRVYGDLINLTVEAISEHNFHRYVYADGTLSLSPVRDVDGENEWPVAVRMKK
ncbi:hypothetical protein M0R72_13835 [Candidatus Pacearchaeota archaeon]|jgi:hypothetical protein|nr:hypothetical protein [Candidatus Pacearchaeota archaeon]